MVIIDTYIVFDCSLFLLLLSFIVVRCKMSCEKWDFMGWVRWCDSSRRAQCCQWLCLLFSSTRTWAKRVVSNGICVCVSGCLKCWVETNKTEFFNRFFCVLFLMCNFSVILFNNYKQTLFFFSFFLVFTLELLFLFSFRFQSQNSNLGEGGRCTHIELVRTWVSVLSSSV